MNRNWFLNHSSSRHAATQRLFCFPYAGGNAYLFRAWSERLPPSIELIGVQAPGKGTRVTERPFTTVTELIDGLLPAIQPLLADKPFSFFGHSNGAMIAFELCAILQERKLPLPQHLFLSASPAPWTRVFERPYSTMDDDAFRAELRDLNGTPPEVLDDPELFDLVLPGLRADFGLAETYTYARPHKLTVPASVYYGEHDEIEEFQIRAWQEQLAAPACFERIAGGHFFIHTHLEQLTDLVGGKLMALDCGSMRAAAVGC